MAWKLNVASGSTADGIGYVVDHLKDDSGQRWFLRFEDGSGQRVKFTEYRPIVGISQYTKDEILGMGNVSKKTAGVQAGGKSFNTYEKVTEAKNFRDYYLVESAKEYTFKLKLAVNDFTAEQKDALESALAKFDLRKVGSYSETPIQKHPLDFPNVRNTKVFMTDLVLGYPVTVDELRIFLSDKIGVNQQSIAVYNANDPREVYTDEAVKIRDNEKDEAYKPYLGRDYEELVNDKPAYGKEYNTTFLQELEKTRKERKVVEVENELSKKVDFDTKEAKDVGEHGGDSVLGNKGGPGSKIKRGRSF